MDIEALLADDGQFKDDGLDDLDVDEAALLGSSGDEDEDISFEKSDTSIRKSSSGYNTSESPSVKRNKYEAFESSNDDDGDILDVGINAEVDDEFGSFSQEDEIRGSDTPDSSKKFTHYKDNLISVTLLTDSSTTPKESDNENIGQAIEDEPTDVIHGADVSSNLPEFDEESDDENLDNDRRGRFKSERSAIPVRTTSKGKADIPDSLDSILSQEETLKVNAFLENQQKRKMFHRSRGQFRGRGQNIPRPIITRPSNLQIATSADFSAHMERSVPMEIPTTPVKVTAPTKIHINPHFRPDANTAIAAIRAAQNFSQGVSSGLSNTSNYGVPHDQNYSYNSATFPSPATERFPQTVTQMAPPPLVTGGIGPVATFHHNVPPPNLHTVPPPPSSSMLQPPPNYMQSNPPSNYSAPVANVIPNVMPNSPHPHNQQAIPNVWIPPPVTVAPPLHEPPPRYNYQTSVGFNTPSDNSYGLTDNFQPPLHQQMERPPSHQQMDRPPPHQQMERPPLHQQMERPPLHQQMERPPPHQQMERPPPHQQMERPPPHQQMERPPPHQQMERPPPQNVYPSNPPTSSWYQEQIIPAPITTKPHQVSNQGHSYLQNINTTSRPVPANYINTISRAAPSAITEVKYQNTTPRYTHQILKSNEPKRFSPIQAHTRKLVKRSTNIAYGNQMVKKYRFEDNQRKVPNSTPIKTNYNIKEIPLVEHLPIEKPQPKPKPPPVEDEDEETKEYRRQIEQQKKMREVFLKQKEERRKIMAAQRMQELQKRKEIGMKNIPMAPKPAVPKPPPEAQGTTKKIILWKEPQQKNIPVKTTVTTQNKPVVAQRMGLQKENTVVQKPVPPQGSKLDLRSRIGALNKKVINTGKIRLIPNKQTPPGTPQQPPKSRAQKIMIATKAGAVSQNTVKITNVAKALTPNLSPRFKRPFAVRKPVHQNKNQRMKAMQFHGNRFSGNRFIPPNVPSGFPSQGTMFPQFQMHMMQQGPQFQNQRFNMNPGNNNTMPLLQFPNPPGKFFAERPPIMQLDHLPPNFNPRLQGHPHEFLMDRARMPPPRFAPPQTFNQRPSPHPGLMMPPPRHHGLPNRNMRGGFQRGNFQKPFNRLKGNSPNSKPAPTHSPPKNENKRVDNVYIKQEITCTNQHVKLEVPHQPVKLEESPPEIQPTSKLVIVSNLSSSTTEAQLQKMSSCIGPVENIKHDVSDRTATIIFKNPRHASQFQSKYKRFMLDLSLIEVTIPPT